MYVCMYVSNILPHVCRTLVPRDPYTPWNALCIPVYWCAHVVIYNWTAKTTGATCVCREDYQRLRRRRQVGECADTWYKPRIQWRQWSCIACLATCQCSCVNQKWPMGLLYSSYCCLWHLYIDIGMTLNCLRVICGCRAIQTNSAET